MTFASGGGGGSPILPLAGYIIMYIDSTMQRWDHTNTRARKNASHGVFRNSNKKLDPKIKYKLKQFYFY